jgi:hypothetical protein
MGLVPCSRVVTPSSATKGNMKLAQSISICAALVALAAACGSNDPNVNSHPGVVTRVGGVGVSGGTRTVSSSYTLVTNTGEAPGGAPVLKSAHYQLVFGFVGTASK